MRILIIADSVGIKGVVQVGVTLESSKWCAELATKDKRVLAAVALASKRSAAL